MNLNIVADLIVGFLNFPKLHARGRSGLHFLRVQQLQFLYLRSLQMPHSRVIFSSLTILAIAGISCLSHWAKSAGDWREGSAPSVVKRS